MLQNYKKTDREALYLCFFSKEPFKIIIFDDKLLSSPGN